MLAIVTSKNRCPQPRLLPRALLAAPVLMLAAASAPALGSDVFMTARRDGTVQQLDSESGAVIAWHVAGITNGRGLAFGPSGGLYVANHQDISRVFSLDCAEPVVSYSSETPHDVTFDSDGSMYVATNVNVHVYDPSGSWLLTFAHGLPTATGDGNGLKGWSIAVRPDNGEIFVVGGGATAVRRFDPETGDLLGSLGGFVSWGGSGIDFTSDGHGGAFLYVGKIVSGADRIRVYDSHLTLLRDIWPSSHNGNPIDLEVDPSTNEIFLINSGNRGDRISQAETHDFAFGYNAAGRGVAVGTFVAEPGCGADLDTDGDGLLDEEELAHGTDPQSFDTDGDGLGDGDETYSYGTDPLDDDTDDDLLSDGYEVTNAQGGCPDPLVPDSDMDGLLDGVEALGLDPCDADSDNDFLADGLEAALGTDGLDPDSDDDGLFDGTEVDMAQGSGCPDPTAADSDGDTLSDGVEANLGTSPCHTDTDGDMVADHEDDLPTQSGVSSGLIEEYLQALSDHVKGMPLDHFAAPNRNACRGRRNAISNKLNDAARAVADGDYQTAFDQLQNLLQKLDDQRQPPDWMVHVETDDAKTEVYEDVELLAFLISLEL